jgi:hypothetical protein
VVVQARISTSPISGSLDFRAEKALEMCAQVWCNKFKLRSQQRLDPTPGCELFPLISIRAR